MRCGRLATRGVLSIAGAAAAAAAASSCAGEVEPREREVSLHRRDAEAAAQEGRLTARPRQPEAHAAAGLQELTRGALLYVPRGYDAQQRYPFVLTLHGAGGAPRNGLEPLLPLADALGLILLAPKSRGGTWDVILGGFGPDVAAIDGALDEAFRRSSVDADRVAVSGFSDGASYALSLGLGNGDLFAAVLAFSPGFSAPATRRGRPAVFVSHGTDDPVLPIGRTSRRIVPSLRRAGYDVDYREFSGGHTVPPQLARAALEQLA